MGFEQYHEPAGELSAEMRTFARMITSMTEEAEAIGWYQQRIALEPDPQARAIMENAQGEEFKHFGMDLEFLLRRTPKWRIALQTILFTDGDIVESGEEAEEAENRYGRDVGFEPTDLLHGKRVVGSVPATRETAAFERNPPRHSKRRLYHGGLRVVVTERGLPPARPPVAPRSGQPTSRAAEATAASPRTPARSRARPRCRRATGAR